MIPGAELQPIHYPPVDPPYEPIDWYEERTDDRDRYEHYDDEEREGCQ